LLLFLIPKTKEIFIFYDYFFSFFSYFIQKMIGFQNHSQFLFQVFIMFFNSAKNNNPPVFKKNSKNFIENKKVRQKASIQQ